MLFPQRFWNRVSTGLREKKRLPTYLSRKLRGRHRSAHAVSLHDMTAVPLHGDELTVGLHALRNRLQLEHLGELQDRGEGTFGTDTISIQPRGQRAVDLDRAHRRKDERSE